MEPDELRIPLRRGVAAALEGLVDLPPPAECDAAARLFVLQTFGDALRASVDLPPSLRRWVRSLHDDEAITALALVAEELPRWTVGAHDDPLSFSLRRRDEIASALDALAWRALVHPPGDALAHALSELERSLARYDASLAVSRREVDAMLEDRAYLADRGWRQALRDDREVDASLLTETVPGDAIVDTWLREGRFHRWVEAAASRDVDFADDLATLIAATSEDARRDPTITLSFVARRWAQRASSMVSVEVPVRPTVLAAATEEAPAEAIEVSLGLLAPLAAHASLDVADGRATLAVYAEPGVLSRLVIGGHEVTPDPDGTCRAGFVTGADPVAVVVHGADAASVDFALTFTPQPEE